MVIHHRGKGSGVFALPYGRVAFSSLTELAPTLEVRLSWGSRTTNVWMLMDTGATLSVLPPSMAKELGLEVGDVSKQAKGIGGDVIVRPSRVHLQLARKDTTGKSGKSWLLDPIMVADSDKAVPIPLLGRRPFLEHHELTVREDKQGFSLRELD